MSNNTVIQSSRPIPKTTGFLDNKALTNCVETLVMAKIQHQIFICADQTITNCCSKQASLESWEYLKKRLQELKLDQPQKVFPVASLELCPIAC